MSDNEAEQVSEDRLMVARESASALMDNEANELDMARVLKESHESDELRAYWARQHAFSDAMRGVGNDFRHIDISSGVSEAIARDKRRYANPLVSMAVAASVTIAVVLGGQQALLFSDDPLDAVTAPGAVVQVPGSGAVQASFAQPTSLSSQPVAGQGGTTRSMSSAEASSVRLFYSELAEDRAKSLAPVHRMATTAASISPFIARSTEPRED